jgi:carotenoid cleavage dioxygenase
MMHAFALTERYDGAYDLPRMIGRGVTLERWTIDPAAGTTTRQALTTARRSSPGSTTGSSPGRTASATARPSANSIWAPWRRTATSVHQRATQVRPGHRNGQAHDFGRHAAAGEAVFAPAPPDAADDDGYVIAFVQNPDRGADLVVLAAQDFTADPIARVHLPARIPRGFHRNWLPEL